MLPLAQLIIIELGCLDICNRNMRKFVVKYNQVHPVLGIKCSIWTAGFLTVLHSLIMNKSQETMVFSGCQKLTSAIKLRPEK